MRLLLVEDDSMIGAAAQQGLRHEGHTVDWVRDGHEAEGVVKGGAYDLVLLDLGLPRKDGLSILRGWRARGIAVPVLIITARDAVTDRVAGLDAGADDYLVKPFDLDELSAREYALLEALADRPGAYLSRAQLEERLYGWDEEIASNAVEVHIHALRRKLDPELIRNVRGLGYTLAAGA